MVGLIKFSKHVETRKFVCKKCSKIGRTAACTTDVLEKKLIRETSDEVLPLFALIELQNIFCIET